MPQAFRFGSKALSDVTKLGSNELQTATSPYEDNNERLYADVKRQRAITKEDMLKLIELLIPQGRWENR
jgi:hypothetical protein